MPRLDLRLQAVARAIRSDVHVDIGSDHGHLLLALLKAGRIRCGIAVENKRQPFLNSIVTLSNVNAEVRFGDGLDAIRPGEGDSISVCGMGGQTIAAILNRVPDRVPDKLILQPNSRSDLIRRWAYDSGYRLTNESFIGRRRFEVLEFSISTDGAEPDPIYDGLDLDTAMWLGPHHVSRRQPAFLGWLEQQHVYYHPFANGCEATRSRFQAIERVLLHRQRS